MWPHWRRKFCDPQLMAWGNFINLKQNKDACMDKKIGDSISKLRIDLTMRFKIGKYFILPRRISFFILKSLIYMNHDHNIYLCTVSSRLAENTLNPPTLSALARSFKILRKRAETGLLSQSTAMGDGKKRRTTYTYSSYKKINKISRTNRSEGGKRFSKGFLRCFLKKGRPINVEATTRKWSESPKMQVLLRFLPT